MKDKSVQEKENMIVVQIEYYIDGRSPSSPQSSSASSSSVSVDFDLPKFLSFFRLAATRRRAEKYEKFKIN